MPPRGTGSPADRALEQQIKSGAKAKVKAKAETDVTEPMSCLTLPATLFSLTAMGLLIADVALGHKHTVIFCAIATGCLLLSALLNCCAGHITANKRAAQHNLLVITNIVVLDFYLYEEESFNYWGHSAQILKEERTGAAILELLVAAFILWALYVQFKPRKAPSDSATKPAAAPAKPAAKSPAAKAKPAGAKPKAMV